MRALNSISLLISTFFYLGYLPFIAGTFGSLAGILLFFWVKDSIFAYALVTLATLVLGFLFSGKAERALARKVPPCVVIDEVSGMLVALMFLPHQPAVMIIAFFLFRLLDTVKPYPANSLQRFKGSFGIMADDIVAAVYTNIVLQLALRLASFRAS